MKKTQKIILPVIMILAVVAIYCTFRIATYLYDGFQNAQEINSLKSQSSGQAAVQKSDASEESSQKNDLLKSKYNSLLAVNPDAAGWINIPGTDIDNPVVRGRDNDYYLTHDINRQESVHGSIFMDYRNNGDANDTNIVIYGHNMKDGSMFGCLPLYNSESYYKKHPEIQLNMRGETTQWTVFSALVLDDAALQVDFNNPVEFAGYIQTVTAKSLYHTGVVVAASDRLLALSTCSHDFDEARFVVYAKKTDAPK